MTPARWFSRLSSPLFVSFACAAISLVLFAILADQVLAGGTREFDEFVRNSIHQHASSSLTVVMRIVTILGSTPFVFAVAGVSGVRLWLGGHRRRAVLLAATVGGGCLLMHILKVAFQRQRPEPFFDTPLPGSYSFPSGHALISFCFYGAAAALITAREKRPWVRALVWAAALIMVLAIGVSRIYLGVHHASDILAGYLAAAFWITGIAIGYRRLRRPEGRS